MMRRNRADILGLIIVVGALVAVYLPLQAGPHQVYQAQLDQPLPAPRDASGPVIILHDRQGHVTPNRQGCQHTGAGNIDVTRPSADTVIFTMKGVAVAGSHPWHNSAAAQDFDLVQDFEIALEKPQGKRLALAMETRVIGLLRSSPGANVAEESGAVKVTLDHAEIFAAPVPSHSVSNGENLGINDHFGPVSIPVPPAKFRLHQIFHVGVVHGRTCCPHKASSAEFAPDPALEPIWISYWEPFHGANKKDFGFQVAIKASIE